MPKSWDDEKVTAVFEKPLGRRGAVPSEPVRYGEVASSVLLNTEDGKRFALVNFKPPGCKRLSARRPPIMLISSYVLLFWREGDGVGPNLANIRVDKSWSPD